MAPEAWRQTGAAPCIRRLPSHYRQLSMFSYKFLVRMLATVAYTASTIQRDQGQA